MRRNPALAPAARPAAKGLNSFVALAFVAVLAIAFWAGVVWIGQFLLRVSASGF